MLQVLKYHNNKPSVKSNETRFFSIVIRSTVFHTVPQEGTVYLFSYLFFEQKSIWSLEEPISKWLNVWGF